MQRDNENDIRLKALEWTVIHFWGEEIKRNPDECVRAVEEAIFEKTVKDEDGDIIWDLL